MESPEHRPQFEERIQKHCLYSTVLFKVKKRKRRRGRTEQHRVVARSTSRQDEQQLARWGSRGQFQVTCAVVLDLLTFFPS